MLSPVKDSISNRGTQLNRLVVSEPSDKFHRKTTRAHLWPFAKITVEPGSLGSSVLLSPKRYLVCPAWNGIERFAAFPWSHGRLTRPTNRSKIGCRFARLTFTLQIGTSVIGEPRWSLCRHGDPRKPENSVRKSPPKAFPSLDADYRGCREDPLNFPPIFFVHLARVDRQEHPCAF